MNFLNNFDQISGMHIAIVVVGCLIVIGFLIVSLYNRLVRHQNLVLEGWSGIDVQLKRRTDLVGNLVEVVKGYSMHEKNVLEKVTAMRAAMQGAHNPAEKMKADSGMITALKSLFAVAENYPDLKANDQYIKLQHQLSDLENEIQLSRRYYNGVVRNYMIIASTFPSNVIASLFGFATHNYYVIDEADRNNPRVKF